MGLQKRGNLIEVKRFVWTVVTTTYAACVSRSASSSAGEKYILLLGYS